MNKFTKKWMVVVAFSSLLVVQSASATLPNDWQLLKKTLLAFSDWADRFFDLKDRTPLKTCITLFSTNIVDPFVILLPVKGAHYTKPELHIRTIGETLHKHTRAMCSIMDEKASYGYLKLGMALKAYNISNIIDILKEQFKQLITLTHETHPELIPDMKAFEQQVIIPLQAKWSTKGALELLPALKHRCGCK